MKRILVALCALILLLPASALALDASKAGKITAEIEARQAEIREKEFGGRSERSMNAKERKAYREKIQEGYNNVLKENGTSNAEYSRALMHMPRNPNSAIEKSRRERAQQIEQEKKSKAEKQKDAGAKGAESSSQIEIQRGPAQQNNLSMEKGIPVQRGKASSGAFR